MQSWPGKIGVKPKKVGKAIISKYQLRACSYKVYGQIPEELTAIKTPLLFKGWLSRYLINPKNLPLTHRLTPR